MKGMEYRDVYTRDGQPLHLTLEKHAPLQKGWYFRHVIVIMKTEDDRYIMQQRSLKARHSAGKWDVTGGGVLSGETDAEAAAREAKEELGIDLDPADMVPWYHEIWDWENGCGLRVSVLAVRTSVQTLPFDFDRTEVEDVDLVGFDSFYAHVTHNKTDGFKQALISLEDAFNRGEL